jgi:lysophospholipase L1-like esterase
MKQAKKILSIFIVIVMLVSVYFQTAAAEAIQASPTTSPVIIDGSRVNFEAYCINGNNYFKLRDIAYALSRTDKRFQVAFDDASGRIVITSRTEYTAAGDELAVSGSTESVDVSPAPFDICLDGTNLTMTAYLIGFSNYVKLRDIAAAIDFAVRYIAESNTIEIDTSAAYQPERTALKFPSDLDVTFIGDSVGAGVAPYLRKYFPNIHIDAKASRQFHASISIIEQLLRENKLSPTVVIGLGTNGTVKESDVRKVIELLGSDRKLVFVNCRVPRSWCEGDNKTFTKVAAEYANVIIADWYSASADYDEYFYKDGFHPNNKGCTVLSQVIANAVSDIYLYQPYAPTRVLPAER